MRIPSNWYESDLMVCKRLGITDFGLANQAMRNLWGHTLKVERDLINTEMVYNPGAAQRRGHITRELQRQLLAEIERLQGDTST